MAYSHLFPGFHPGWLAQAASTHPPESASVRLHGVWPSVHPGQIPNVSHAAAHQRETVRVSALFVRVPPEGWPQTAPDGEAHGNRRAAVRLRSVREGFQDAVCPLDAPEAARQWHADGDRSRKVSGERREKVSGMIFGLDDSFFLITKNSDLKLSTTL